MDVESHPLKPFLPDNTKVLMLGSFPPAKTRWCMAFFYPNFNNDMWRIFGLVFFNDKEHFIVEDKKLFDKDSIIKFLSEKGIGIFDTATEIRRTKNTASDKDLEIITKTDIEALLRNIPKCEYIVTTGQKATDQIVEHFRIAQPKVGDYTEFTFYNRSIRLYRMPSSSRAYPLKIEKKADIYKAMFLNIF